MIWVVNGCHHFELERQIDANLHVTMSPHMITSSNGHIFRITGPLCGEFTGHRWIPHTKASDTEIWCFLWSVPWINSWVNNRQAGDLRRHRAHYDVTVMSNRQPMKYSCLKHIDDMDLKHQCNWLTQYTRQSRLIIVWLVPSQRLTMDTTSQTAIKDDAREGIFWLIQCFWKIKILGRHTDHPRRVVGSPIPILGDPSLQMWRFRQNLNWVILQIVSPGTTPPPPPPPPPKKKGQFICILAPKLTSRACALRVCSPPAAIAVTQAISQTLICKALRIDSPPHAQMNKQRHNTWSFCLKYYILSKSNEIQRQLGGIFHLGQFLLDQIAHGR